MTGNLGGITYRLGPVRQRGGPEREIPLTDIDQVMWSP
jgi:hypothetical protein